MKHIVSLQIWSEDKKHSIRKEITLTKWFELYNHYKQMIDDIKKMIGCK